ncbi:MAG: M14 family zinc carboxypeptidase [Desulfococcaceae bacterium]|nr:M14 family zinc carboxypeptidase [Desulfococcaceae bacterium]
MKDTIRIYSPALILAMVIFILVTPKTSLPMSPDLPEIIKAEVLCRDREELMGLIRSGADIANVRGNRVLIYSSEKELGSIRDLGYEFRIIRDSPENLQRRSASYYSFAEMSAELARTAENYPHICRLSDMGMSVQGRKMWIMKLTDHPDAEEDEPEILFVSSMHGDEPLGMELSMRLIRLLAESYGRDAKLTQLLNECEIWIMPLMNPDGYVNQSRYNAEGKDLNRSFPDRVIDPENTVEGRAAEVRHFMNWVQKHSPVLSANFHTGALLVNYPYDSDPVHTDYAPAPDNALFIEQSLTYSRLNPPMYNSPWFRQGIVNGVEWYTVYGGMQDWLYHWYGCSQVTVELSNIFIPPYSAIPSLWEDNREAMIAYAGWALKGIRGRVTNRRTGFPLGAAVRVMGNEHVVYTDPDAGDYHRMLLPGIYSIEISAPGYVSRTVSGISVGDGEAVRADAALDPLREPGDVNGDGNLQDLITVLQILSSGEAEEPEMSLEMSWDVNGDGNIGLAEAVYLLRCCSLSPCPDDQKK